MVPFALLFISIIPIVILSTLTARANKSGSRFQTAILGATLVHESALVVFPVWYSVFTDFYLERRMILGVTSDDLLVVMIGETIFVTLFAVGIMFGRQRTVQKRQTLSLTDSPENLMISSLVGIGLLLNVSQFVAPPTTFSEMVVHSQGQYYNTTIGMLESWVRGFFQFPSLIACSFVVAGSGKRKYPFIIRLMAVSTLVLMGLTGLSMGIRGRIAWVVSLLAIMGFTYRRKLPMIWGIVLLVLTLPLFAFLGGAYRSIYYSEAGIGASKIQLLSVLLQQTGHFSDQIGDFVPKFADRAQAPRNSVVLYKLHDQGFGAGLRPVVGAIVTFIPRKIWPTKWVAGSYNTSTYGGAVYLVRYVGYGAPGYNMGPYLASAHAYWEGGWIGLVLFGLVTGLLWNVLFRWYMRTGSVLSMVVGITFAFGVLANGLPTMLQPLYDFVRLFWVTALPTIIFGKLANRISMMKGGSSRSSIYPNKRNLLGRERYG